MTDTTEAPSSNGQVQLLPGAARAKAFTEPIWQSPTDLPSGETLSWERFAEGSLSTDALADGGYVPPPPPEAPAEWMTAKTRLLRILSAGLAHPAPGQEELAHRGWVRLIREATWPRSVRIAVGNHKGGVGKTTTSVVLSGILASVRGGSVAVWDASDAAGTLASRTEGVAARCISEIEAEPDAYLVPSTVSMVTATQTSFADVLGSLREREFTDASVERVSEVLDRTYKISVADTGNVPHSPPFEAVIARADILVVPTTLQADSVNKAIGLLRRLRSTPTGLVQRAVVAVLHNGAPETPGLGKQVEKIFENVGVGAVVHLPFDPHLGAGTAITLANLSHASQVAWTRLAASTVSNINV